MIMELGPDLILNLEDHLEGKSGWERGWRRETGRAAELTWGRSVSLSACNFLPFQNFPLMTWLLPTFPV